ncbi:hypothetical protein KIN20_028934 [Parelaphostrongylus tenuis]|uniref:Uncharacterized protein n=1 Tax=Parelaphostrongylus tenuis TaxID=148309 RepID=A0AAD5WF30_PARTN|nr:hypothetical protein KIN20_028934 [Parelaphostrongylus tenuis]
MRLAIKEVDEVIFKMAAAFRFIPTDFALGRRRDDSPMDQYQVYMVDVVPSCSSVSRKKYEESTLQCELIGRLGGEVFIETSL